MRFIKKSQLITIVTAGVLALSGSVFAEEQAANLSELLQMMKESKISETKEQQKREADFRRSKANQANLLKQAEATKAAEERRSTQLETKFKEQDLLVQQKRAQYEERLGSLKELFGHLTSTAGDLRATLDTSLVSAQYPNRGDFMADLIEKMNSETKLPTLEEIEKLWYELQRETIESGKVVKFTAEVSDPAGNKTTQEIVRIGNYNLVAGGKYLTYEGKTGTISELSRQPSGQEKGAIALQSASSGFVKVGIDPTGPSGGSLLKALINSPNLVERWHQGGVVGYVITAVFGIALIISLWRWLALMAIGSAVSKQLKTKAANPKNALGRIMKVAEDNPNIDGESLELKLEEAVLKERPTVEGWLGSIKIISMVAPLLGLLGTVTGMIQTFQAITIYGAGDPKAMAGGISGALVTTVLGLIVAIPTVLIHTFLNSKAKGIVHVLDEQSAGLIAEKIESK